MESCLTGSENMGVAISAFRFAGRCESRSCRVWTEGLVGEPPALLRRGARGARRLRRFTVRPSQRVHTCPERRTLKRHKCRAPFALGPSTRAWSLANDIGMISHPCPSVFIRGFTSVFSLTSPNI